MPRRAFGLLALPALAATAFAAEPVRKQAPTIYAGGVVNAASFVPAPDNFVAPLSIVSIFGEDLSLRTAIAGVGGNGRLPLAAGGVRVTINSIPVPLFYVSPTQINAQIPERLVPRERPWEIRIVRESLASPLAAEVFVRAAAPGLFSVFIRADASVIGRRRDLGETPAAPGEAVAVFGTGFGPTNPLVLAGELPPVRADAVLPWTVRVGERALPREAVPYVGQAPTFAGLNQINFVVPEDLPAGDHAVSIEVAGARSQAGVELAVAPGP